MASQFEEPHIKKVVNDAAATKSEALMLKQIMPAVDRFKTQVAAQLEQLEKAVEGFKTEVAAELQEIKKDVAQVASMKSQTESNAKEIGKALSYARNSQSEIGKFRKSISGLQSDLIKINRGIVEIQYFTYKNRGRFGDNPYQPRIEQKMNELLAIAVPDPQERSRFVNELNSFKPDQ